GRVDETSAKRSVGPAIGRRRAARAARAASWRAPARNSFRPPDRRDRSRIVTDGRGPAGDRRGSTRGRAGSPVADEPYSVRVLARLSRKGRALDGDVEVEDAVVVDVDLAVGIEVAHDRAGGWHQVEVDDGIVSGIDL